MTSECAVKLAKLIVVLGRLALLRVIYGLFHPPWWLPGFLNSKIEDIQSLWRKGLISKEQWEVLFPPDGSLPDVENLDVRLLTLILTNVCGLKQPKRGWRTLPLSRDSSLEANLARLITYRDEVCDECRSSEPIDNESFHSWWEEIESVLVALKVTREEVEVLKNEPADNENELQFLIQWAEEEKRIDQLLNLDEKQQNTQENLQSILTTQGEALSSLTTNGSQVKIIGNIKYNASEKNVIGKGGKGTLVYKGTLKAGTEVAVKKMFTGMFDNVEIDKLKTLKHPHIIRCLEIAQLDEFTYLALELCDKTLAECVKKDLFKTEDLQLNQLTCMLQISDALSYLHERKISHRDIKPENILLVLRDGLGKQCFVVADFNTAREVRNESFSTNKSVAGTNGWIAPELYQPGVRRTLKVDVFSFGCLSFYIVTNGRHPFGQISDLKTCQSNINSGKQATHLFKVNELEECNQLGDLVYAMTETDPNLRPTAKAVYNKVKAILADIGNVARDSQDEQGQLQSQPIKLHFKCFPDLHRPEKLDKFFEQCRKRFLTHQFGKVDNAAESLKSRFTLLILEVVFLARMKHLRPKAVVENPKTHGIYSFYLKDYLGESYRERDLKDALKKKLPQFQDLSDKDLKWNFYVTFYQAKNFLFFEQKVLPLS